MKKTKLVLLSLLMLHTSKTMYANYTDSNLFPTFNSSNIALSLATPTLLYSGYSLSKHIFDAHVTPNNSQLNDDQKKQLKKKLNFHSAIMLISVSTIAVALSIKIKNLFPFIKKDINT